MRQVLFAGSSCFFRRDFGGPAEGQRVNGSTVDPPAVKQHMDPWGSQPRADGWLLRFEFTIYYI